MVEARAAGGWRQAVRASRLVCLGLLLSTGMAGCESAEQFYTTKLPLDEPLDWWHRLQGGPIADERPPPPGVGDPYSNFGTVPPRPTPTDAPSRRALLAQLARERDRATRAAAQDPIVAPVAAPAARTAGAKSGTASSGTGTPAATGDEAPGPMARIDAADAPPAPAVVVPAAGPAPASIQAAASPVRPARPGVPGGEPGAAMIAGPAPALPGGPPPLPALAGIPSAVAGPAAAKAPPQVIAAFLPASAVLRPETSAALQSLAARRGGGPVAVLGGGDAVSAAPADQVAALGLAWRRARAIEAVMLASGVPPASLRVDAAALARGGLVRLVE